MENKEIAYLASTSVDRIDILIKDLQAIIDLSDKNSFIIDLAKVALSNTYITKMKVEVINDIAGK